MSTPTQRAPMAIFCRSIRLVATDLPEPDDPAIIIL